MPYNNPVDIYNRAPKNPEFLARNFFIHYKDLYDQDRIKVDREEYQKLLRNVAKAFQDFNFRQNILVICKERLYREIFFHGCSTFEEYPSYYLCNIENISDIWFDVPTDDAPFKTEQALTQKVLCVYGDRDLWVNAGVGAAMNTVLSSRTAGNSPDGKPQYTWIFFRGTYSDMLKKNINDKESGWTSILELFLDADHSEYSVIDLNKSRARFLEIAHESNEKWRKKRMQLMGGPGDLVMPKKPSTSNSNADIDY
jgi:hypothetical protein